MLTVLAVAMIVFQVANVLATAYLAGKRLPIIPTPGSLVMQAIKDAVLIYLLVWAYLWPR